MSNSGLFVLEKYLRIEEKPDQQNVPSFIKERPDNLYGVVNLKDFQDYIDSQPLARKYKYSECFGDLRFMYKITVGELRDAGISYSMIERKYLRGLDTKLIKEIRKGERDDYVLELPESHIPNSENFANMEPIGIEGSTGVKYGIRLCYIPPSGFSGGQVSADYAMKNKAYNVQPVGGANTKYIFPIAESEIELIDGKLSGFDWEDHSVDPYDLECMVDKLLLEPGYYMFFNRFIPLKRYMSFFATYISLSFLPALGEGPDERVVDDSGLFNPNDPEGNSGWDRILFDDVKKTCRKLFADYYNSNDFNPEDGSEANTVQDFIRNINPFSNVIPGIMTWWQRRNLTRKPPECKNAFAEMFKE